MKIAVISDIHANITALQAVLEDIDSRDVVRIYCTGDLVGYAPFPNEVIDLVRARGIPAVMGNYDDAIGNLRFICGCDYKDEKARVLGEKSVMWTKEHTLAQNREFLQNLPLQISFTENNRRVLMVHGSPRKLNEYLTEDVADDYFAQLMEETGTDVLVCGHTHIPFYRSINDRYIINAGSVGRPKHGDPQASYVVISLDDEVEVEIIKVQYDFEAVAGAIEESALPDEFAETIRRGC